MTNDNKLFESIINSGKEQAKLITDEARKKADSVISEAEKTAQTEATAISKEADTKAVNMKNSALSSASLIGRNALLEAKRAEINKTLEALADYINSLDDEKYFALLCKFAEGLDAEKGTLFFNKRDLDRLPSDFVSRIKKAGIDADISEESADISGGFILKNGAIESNCSVNAVIEDRKNELEDFINRYLFVEES